MKILIATLLLNFNFVQVEVKSNTNDNKGTEDESSQYNLKYYETKGFEFYYHRKLTLNSPVEIT
jgi:hypothetical protein